MLVRIKRLIISAIILLLIALSVNYKDLDLFAANNLKHILILNSYHPSLSWTESINDSITSNFNKYPEKYYTHVEYMDWKNFPKLENLNLLYKIYEQKYKDIHIDMIITTDDTALKFAVINRKEIFSDAPIIFTGVNQENAQEIIGTEKNITGIIAEADVENTLLLMKTLYPNLKNIYTVYDETESGLSMGKEAVNAIKRFDENINIIESKERTIKDITHKIDRLPEDSAVLVTIYYNDSENTIQGFSSNTRYIVENIRLVPVFVLYDFNLGTGAIGGSLLSSELIGKETSQIAIEYLKSSDHSKDPFINIDIPPYQVVDYDAMKRFGLNTKDIPEGFQVVNKPVTIMDTHGKLVYTTITILVGLIMALFVLVYYVNKLFYLQNSLKEKNDEQKALYEELASSEEELQAQYEELNNTYNELQNAQTRLNHMAYHDQLTNLGNRASFLNYFDTIIKKVSNGHGAIVLIDIDNFKRINDTMGHVFGDKLIRAVGMKLQSLLYYPFEVFRIGGDEFVLALPHCNNNEAQKVTELILTQFSEPINIEEHSVNITISMGISFYPMDGKTSNDLLTKADVAMYHSKDTGKNKVTLFSTKMLDHINKMREIEKNLELALINNEFNVYFQPQMDIKNNKIWGFEALIRWNSPVLGFVPPLEFISLAEESQLIIPIGHFVLEQACAFIKKTNEEMNEKYMISINASPVEIVQADYVRKVIKTLDKYQLPYNVLEVEVTESIMVESFEIVNEKLRQLKEKGVGVALDDFGTGYSSLSYIQRLPITTLKIDKSFIDDIPGNQVMCNLVKSIIGIGKQLDFEVVTEGVESKEQMEFLALNSADRIQGYYYSKPIPEQEINSFLRENNILNNRFVNNVSMDID